MSKSTKQPSAATSGKRHHYIPRFLLNQFALGSPGSGSIRCVHRGKLLERVNVNNVCVESDFYQPAGAFNDPERILASRESEFATAHKTWHGMHLLDKKHAELAGEFVLHLRIRSKSFRAHSA